MTPDDTLYARLLATFKGLQFSTAVADDLAERAADVADAWHREQPTGVPPQRLAALVRLLGPQEMTPTAKRQFDLLCQEYDGG